MDDHRYHVRTCNSLRGPGYPCDCPYPQKPENPFVALEAENKRLRDLLAECAEKLRRCCIASGTDPEFADAAVAKYLAALDQHRKETSNER